MSGLSSTSLVGEKPPALPEHGPARAAPSAVTRRVSSDTTHPKSSSAPARDYVGSQACSGCHADIYSHYMRTSMAGSIVPATAEAAHSLPLPASVYNAQFDRYFNVDERDGQLIESESQRDAQGRELFRTSQPIRWLVGHGANGIGGLTLRDGYLFEAPLSYYTHTASWDLSPGYERADTGFSRVVVPGCISCHSGRPQPVADTSGKYAAQPFRELAVGCENCHGPASAHVAAMSQGDSYPRHHDPTIANPAAMVAARANDLCMSCHQAGDVRVYEPGKSYQDFRPGMPLARIMAVLMVPPRPGEAPDEDHVQHYYALTMSKCFRATANGPDEGRLRCISCHDPHVEPTHAEAPAYFNGKCRSCHTQASCKAPAATRQAAADNCIGCHMPQRADHALAHTELTNHRIVRTPDEPMPLDVASATSAALPDLIYLNRDSAAPASVSPSVPAASAPSLLAQLAAYGQLKAQRPQYLPSWQRVLAELERLLPEDASVQAALGDRALAAGATDEAQAHFRRALGLAPSAQAAGTRAASAHNSLSTLSLDTDQARVYMSLSAIADGKGDAAEALAMARKAAALDPWNQTVRKTLVLRMVAAQDYTDAQSTLAHYVSDFPQDDGMRRMLTLIEQP